jgi:predicted RNA binding protein YcfA (HicA-like mRNA interferase family)
MKTADVVRALRKAGCVVLRDNGRHTVYQCPCGQHAVPIPTTHADVTAGVLRDVVAKLACLPKGWLQ